MANPLPGKSSGNCDNGAAGKSEKNGTRWDEQKICDTPVPVEPGWKLTGFDNEGVDPNLFPPSKYLVV